MFLVALEMYAETASFRVSETHTFHKTLALPPYTTCVGLLGAALGLDMESAQSYVEENGISIGVAGHDRGDGGGRGCSGAADLPRRLDQRPWCTARQP